MPAFPVDLPKLAAEALTRILDDDSGLAANWVDPDDATRWLATLNRLHAALAPPPSPTDIPLFDMDP
jgi:hypothetical protein